MHKAVCVDIVIRTDNAIEYKNYRSDGLTGCFASVVQFYELRAEITKILITEHGFSAVATEAGKSFTARAFCRIQTKLRVAMHQCQSGDLTAWHTTCSFPGSNESDTVDVQCASMAGCLTAWQTRSICI